ncbi:MAG: haloacid dehalogenase type II [Acidobacteria bacterium]|nr:haloacid dehalogenase type II [Acidobacteriota bacterium]
MLDFSSFRALTFDCYGTLINWEAGILGCLRPLLDAHGQNCSDDQILELYAQIESEQESGEYIPYRCVLENVVRGFGRHFGFTPTAAQVSSLPESLPGWQPFPDTVAGLRALKSRYQLAIISNTDDDLFAATAKLLEVPFDYVVTAQQAGSYKPSHRNFELALERIGRPKREVLHVAQSLYHDIGPARELGLANVWIRRGKHAARATRPGTAQADLGLPDIASLAKFARGGR